MDHELATRYLRDFIQEYERFNGLRSMDGEDATYEAEGISMTCGHAHEWSI